MALSMPDVGDYNSDLVAELNKAIDIYFDAFIAEDDLEKQRQIWSSLQENAQKYLCLVPHNRKFKFKETDRILQESIHSLKDFNPIKASYAFECLVKYGYNLITQPWRQDFHTIKVTSGFYVHNISSNLKNAQEILIAMGYVNILDNSLKLVPNYELSNVKDVSRDCILACQECIILSKMMEHVSYEEPNCTLKFESLYDFRCKNKGDIAEMCKSVVKEVRRSRPNKAIKNTMPLDAKGHSNKSSVGSGDHFYDDVSVGDIPSLSSSPATRRSKSMVFATSTPKKVIASQNDKKSVLAYKEEKYPPTNKGETVLNGSLTPRTLSNIRNQHVYQNVPYLRRNNDTNPSKSSLNREKTKWHTPMKNKLNPQKHLTHVKLSEQEIELLANESDSEDTKEESGFTKSSNFDKDKSISDDNKIVPGANKPFSGNIGDKCGPDLISGVTGVMQYAKDFSAALFAKSSPGKPSSNSTQGYSKYYEDDGTQSVVSAPVKSSKSSYSPSSQYDGNDFTAICGKEGSTASSTVASSSSWDRKLRSGKVTNKRVPPDEHFYDEPPFSDNSANNKRATSKNSQSTTLVNGSSDPSLYYENVEYSAESVGLGFGHSKKNNNQTISRNPNNSTYLTCKNSLKSQQDELPSGTASKKREREKLDDLEDVWLHTLLNKGDKFNYLEPQGNNMMLDDCSTETDSNISATADHSTIRYDDDGYDGDTSGAADMLKRNNQMKPMNDKNSKQVRESEFVNTNSKGKPSEKKLSFEPWNCKFCTFFNTSNESICEICCKSKDNLEDDDDVIAVGETEVPRHSKAPSLPDFMGDENFMASSPISSGRKLKQITCPQCTLLNVKTARLCDACGFRLIKYSSPSRTSWLEDIGREYE